MELLAVVTPMGHFKYYLTGRHLTVVTDHASLTWLRNFKEPRGGGTMDHSATPV